MCTGRTHLDDAKYDDDREHDCVRTGQRNECPSSPCVPLRLTRMAPPHMEIEVNHFSVFSTVEGGEQALRETGGGVRVEEYTTIDGSRRGERQSGGVEAGQFVYISKQQSSRVATIVG